MISMTWPQYLRGECRVSGFTVRLSPQEAELLSEMLVRYPREVKEEELVAALWPDPETEPEWALANLRALVHRVRHKIGGFRIGNRGPKHYAQVQLPGEMRP